MGTQLYEMRTYTTHSGKLEDLNRRFRDHTTRIFANHGMVNVGYWIPQDSARSENTLVYILAYPSREAREEAWAAFFDDPEWQAALEASEANGPIVDRVESVFMEPTDYSELR
ncbi:MAG: NIPSNAP family protein [Gemmatimonas sp.]|nr:NIPSNAP family protein [Gemmatimonas sp.]